MENIISFSDLGLSFNVNRVAFYIGDFSVYWYGLIIAFGLVLASCYAFKESKIMGLDVDDLLNMILIALPVSIICARLYYVIFSWESYKDSILDIFDIRSGGLAIYGGIIGATSVVIIYCLKKKIKIGVVLDILAIGLLIGQSIGRWGNFVNGEAFGASTTLPWAMTIENDFNIIAENVHPTFLYESIWNGLGIIILLCLKKHRKFNGELFCYYLIWYGTGRTIIEALRADSLYFGMFRISQLLAVFCIIIGVISIVINRKRYIKLEKMSE